MKSTLMLLAAVAAMALAVWTRWLLWCWFVDHMFDLGWKKAGVVLFLLAGFAFIFAVAS